jgi:hypothetical protein
MSDTPRTDECIAAIRKWECDPRLYAHMPPPQSVQDHARALEKALLGLYNIILEDDGVDCECWSPRYRALIKDAEVALGISSPSQHPLVNRSALPLVRPGDDPAATVDQAS